MQISTNGLQCKGIKRSFLMVRRSKGKATQSRRKILRSGGGIILNSVGSSSFSGLMMLLLFRSLTFLHVSLFTFMGALQKTMMMSVMMMGEHTACSVIIIVGIIVAHPLWATGRRPSVADRGSGVSASCIVGPIVR